MQTASVVMRHGSSKLVQDHGIIIIRVGDAAYLLTYIFETSEVAFL